MIAVFWSETAKNDYWDNIDYLQQNWTLVEVYNFIDKVEKISTLLTQENILFKATFYKDVYQVVVVKQITLFYQITPDNSILLLRFWNNYQNPKRFKLT